MKKIILGFGFLFLISLTSCEKYNHCEGDWTVTKKRVETCKCIATLKNKGISDYSSCYE